jgi:uncharacterized delta-60 repeat protein
VLGDGRIVAAGTSNGNFAVARLRANGSPDPTFSGDGKVTVDFGGADAARALALLAGGDILVAGGGGTGGDVAVARFNGDGSLDSSFSGDGKLTTDFGGAADRGNAVLVLTGGRFAVVGTATRGADNPAAGVFADSDFAVAAFNADGSPDTTFSGDGRATTDFFGRSSDAANAAVVDATGGIVAVGTSDGDFALARYLTDRTNPPPPPPDEIILQAEDATLVGAVVRRDNPGYQGTGYADFINTSGDYVEWTFDLPSGGSYDLIFRYANGSSAARPMRILVNDQPISMGQGFGPTGSWRTWSNFEWSGAGVPLELRTGRNVIRLTADGFSGPNIDSLTIRPAGEQPPPPPPQVLQAERQELRGPVVRSENPGFTGTGYVDYLAPAGESIRWAVNIEQGGQYELTFRYANGSTASRPLAVSLGETTFFERVQFRPTGSWTTWGTDRYLMGFLPGVQFLSLTSEGASGPNIDSLTVTKV